MKKIYFLLLALCCLINLHAQSPNFAWAAPLGGSGYDLGRAIAVDASGNVYTTGNFAGTADFDPGIANYDLISAGLSDIFVSKVDASGNFVWATRIGSTSDEAGQGI